MSDGPVVGAEEGEGRGYNNFGQGDPKPGPYSQISAGGWHTCGLTQGAAVECWGRGDYGQTAGQAGPYTGVTAGEFHTCALAPSGAVDCWGQNSAGQAADPMSAHSATAAAEMAEGTPPSGE